MKSVKPGRGPSFMGGIWSLAAAAFGVFWTRSAYEIGARVMVPFGVLFILMAVAAAIYSFVGASSKNRFSEFDIVDGDEEPDPLNEHFGREGTERKEPQPKGATGDIDADFCPYCGARAAAGHRFCRKCGKEMR